MPKVLFLYYDPHYLHSAFAQAIGADFLSSDFVATWTKSKKIQIHKKILGVLAPSLLLPKDYDIYLCEGSFILPVIAKKLRLQPKRGKIVNFIADPLVYYLHTGVIKGAKRSVLLNLLREVDGFICISEMEKELLLEFVNKPAIVVDPFIRDKLYKRYMSISPDLASHNIVFVARGPDWFYKGVDLLVDGFNIAKKEISELRLNIVGEWEPKKEWLVNGVKFVGQQKNLAPYFKRSSLYVHVGRGEAFGISVLEAMLSGLPAMVSKWTGAKTVAEKLGRNFVSDIKAEDVAEKIMKYFDLNLEKRKALSRKAKALASDYSREKKVKLFVERFQKLVEETK